MDVLGRSGWPLDVLHAAREVTHAGQQLRILLSFERPQVFAYPGYHRHADQRGGDHGIAHRQMQRESRDPGRLRDGCGGGVPRGRALRRENSPVQR